MALALGVVCLGMMNYRHPATEEILEKSKLADFFADHMERILVMIPEGPQGPPPGDRLAGCAIRSLPGSDENFGRASGRRQPDFGRKKLVFRSAKNVLSRSERRLCGLAALGAKSCLILAKDAAP